VKCILFLMCTSWRGELSFAKNYHAWAKRRDGYSTRLKRHDIDVRQGREPFGVSLWSLGIAFNILHVRFLSFWPLAIVGLRSSAHSLFVF
jgi:hypothetical protein